MSTKFYNSYGIGWSHLECKQRVEIYQSSIIQTRPLSLEETNNTTICQNTNNVKASSMERKNAEVQRQVVSPLFFTLLMVFAPISIYE